MHTHCIKSLLFAATFLSGTVLAASDNEPNWILLLLVFILSSAIGAALGIYLLASKPRIADPPVYKDPFHGNDEPVMTTYKQFPLEYDGMGSDMYPMSTRNYQSSYNYGEQIATQEL